MVNTHAMRAELEAVPSRMAALPIDARGYPVPWFVAWVEGVPDHRIADGAKYRRAIAERRCWICGLERGVYQAFVVGPMCGINRTASDPPAHLECALWSARNRAQAGGRRAITPCSTGGAARG